MRLPILVESGVSGREAELTGGRSMGRALRILVVDDNRDCAISLASLLAAYDHEVQAVYDGEEAIATASHFQPHLVLLDIAMPGLDGYSTCRRILEQSRGFRPRIVAVTGFGQEADRQKSKDAGFDAHLIKPVDSASLLQLLDACAAGAS